MALLSKIKSHFDAVNYFKEIPLYKVAVIERKDPVVQLEASKSSFQDLFSDLLNETKGFKYRINVKVLLKKYKLNGEIEFALVFFNSLTKTVINNRFWLESSFQEFSYMIDVWINKGSRWNVESIESQCINISTYRPLSGSSYISLPVELRSPRKHQKQRSKMFFTVSC